MGWRETFKSIVDSQNSQYPQKGEKTSNFENIEDFVHNIHKGPLQTNYNNNFKIDTFRKYSQNSQNYLPSACPLLTGKVTSGVARRCRLELKLIERLARTNLLSSLIGCSLSSVCGLWCPWPRRVQPGGDGTDEAKVRCLGFECELVSYRYEDGVDRANAPMLWCGRADSAVIDLSRCPLNNWKKDEHGLPHGISENQ